MFKSTITTFVLFLISLFVVAQEIDKKTQRAINNFNDQQYTRAISQLKDVLKDNKENYLALKYLANSYRKINAYEKAETYFTLLVNSVNVEAEDHLYYGQLLKANGKLASAKEQFIKFSEKSENSFLGNLMVQSFDQIETWEKQPKSFKVKTGEGLNSIQSEYGFLAFKDKYYITSNREKNYNSPEAFSWDGTPFMSVFEIDTAALGKEDAEFTIVGGRLNTDYHDGPLTINQAEDRVIITRVDNQLRGKNFINRMKLYEGVYEGGKWKNFKSLPFNSDDFSNGQAVFGENDQIIYFTSDRPGGYGGMDLYKSERVNDKWGDPVNLGAVINTSQNEVFPFFRKNKLYFSSAGYGGYGGLDILVSEFKDGWQPPTNLRSPINSSRDDFGIYYITDSTGYYSSNRDGGKGRDDIYSFYQSSKILSVAVTGVFEYKGLPVEGVKIILINSNDSIIAVEYTDEKGNFKFSNLPYQEDVLVQLETDSVELYDDGRLYLTNENGDKIKLIERLKNGDFTFTALPPDELEEIELFELKDSKLVDVLNYGGRIYKKLPGDYEEEVMVYLVDDNGQVVDSALTDRFGNFKFKKLGLEEDNYFVQIAEEDVDLNIAFVNEQGRIYELASGQDGKFEVKNGRVGQKNKGFTAIIARLEGNGKPLPFTKVNIFNETGEIIATVFTNEKGEFQYNKLSLDGDYSFGLPDLTDSADLEAKIYVIDYNGEQLYLINQLQDGKFAFQALPLDEFKELQLLEESLVPELVELKGQIFDKLPGDYSDSLKVYLLDEEGNVLDSVFTDLKGQFNFEKLDPDKNYSFKLEESESLSLALLDNQDKIIEQAIINEKGNFTYRKLTYQVATFEQLEEVDAKLIEDELTHEIYGQVYQKLPGDFESGMEVYIYDENGELVGTALTDEKGKFKFKKLNPDGNYYFRIEHHEEDFQLLTLDDDENILDKTIKNEKGFFKYHTLKYDENVMLIEDEIDHHQVLYFDEKKIELDAFTVYYRFDTIALNTESKIKLNSFVELIKNQNFFVEVHSYTDTRGPEVYNNYLSKQRTNNVIEYLVKQGLNREEINGNYYGELNPVVDCETKKCNNDDHALNRRTVVKLRKEKLKR